MADDDPVASALKASPLSPQQRHDLWDLYYNSTDLDALEGALKTQTIPAQVKHQLWDLKSKESAPPAAPEAPPETPERTWGETAVEVGKGALKAAGRTVLGAGESVLSNPVFGTSTMALNAMRAVPAVKATEQQVRSTLENKSLPQSVGGVLETGAEMLIPLGAAKEAIPTTTKAAAKFQDVMGAAKNFPIDTSAPGQVALRIHELAEHGGSLPMSVRKFINYVTDPKKPPMTYEVARDFASNISSLSVDEFHRLKPVLKYELGNLRVALNKANADAASAAGKGAEYAQAMNEYARAKRFTDIMGQVVAGAKKAAPFGLGAGIVAGPSYWAGKKLYSLWSGE